MDKRDQEIDTATIQSWKLFPTSSLSRQTLLLDRSMLGGNTIFYPLTYSHRILGLQLRANDKYYNLPI